VFSRAAGESQRATTSPSDHSQPSRTPSPSDDQLSPTVPRCDPAVQDRAIFMREDRQTDIYLTAFFPGEAE